MAPLRPLVAIALVSGAAAFQAAPSARSARQQVVRMGAPPKDFDKSKTLNGKGRILVDGEFKSRFGSLVDRKVVYDPSKVRFGVAPVKTPQYLIDYRKGGKTLFGGLFSSAPKKLTKAEVNALAKAEIAAAVAAKGKPAAKAGKGLPSLPFGEKAAGKGAFDYSRNYAKLPDLPDVVASKLPKVSTITSKVPERNPARDVVDKARDLDVVGKFVGLDFAGLLDWGSRSELIKRVTVLGLFGGSVTGLALQAYLQINAEAIAAGAENKAKAAPAAKVAAPADKKKAAAKPADDKEKAAKAKVAEIEKEKAAIAKKAADEKAAAEKKAAADAKAAKEKAEKDAKEAARKADEDSATAARQVMIDKANKSKSFKTSDYVEGSKARRQALLKSYNFDPKAIGSLDNFAKK